MVLGLRKKIWVWASPRPWLLGKSIRVRSRPKGIRDRAHSLTSARATRSEREASETIRTQQNENRNHRRQFKTTNFSTVTNWGHLAKDQLPQISRMQMRVNICRSSCLLSEMGASLIWSREFKAKTERREMRKLYKTDLFLSRSQSLWSCWRVLRSKSGRILIKNWGTMVAL